MLFSVKSPGVPAMKPFVLELALRTALLPLLLSPALARAQSAEAPDAGATPRLVAPEPVAIEPAAFPDAARALGIAEASVVLRLSIDASGTVTDAEVIEPAGHGFDEAARAALLRSRFSPALRDGQAMAARIRYRYVFASEVPAPAVPAPAVPAPAVPTDVASRAASQAQAQTPTAIHVLPPAEEVQVRGRVSEEEQLEQSAEAVTVFDAKRARRESSELGEVLARLPGVAIRRAGGLGSDERLSLNGLSDDRVPTFLDGVPLDLAFFPFGVASFPVSLVDRVEIYKGVVPLRFGADALGGAVNLVTDRRYESGGSASYEIGSFGTQRATLGGAYRDDDGGFVLNGMGFVDVSDNDYEVDVEVPDARGRLHPARVDRFHDAYGARGGTIELGVVERPWARRLTLRTFWVGLDKELQHNLVMTVPYGEARYAQSALGATARYEVEPSDRLELELIASYAYRTAELVDKAAHVYDWFGERVRERRVHGEIEAEPRDQIYRWQTLAARALVAYSLAPQHVLSLVSMPHFTTATGDERLESESSVRDPLSAERVRTVIVSGIEYEANLFAMPDAPAKSNPSQRGTDYRFQNLLFVKDYLYLTASEEPLAGGFFSEREKSSHTFGIGDGVRYRFTRELLAKASYEYATRLPQPDEVFGDAVLILDNLELEPEVSHNANLGAQLDLEGSWSGDYHAELTGFWREADKLIVLLGNDRFFSHQNVYAARSVGIESALTWTSPGDYVALDGSATFQEFRNTSSEGTFGDFEGDRIPNRPWLFGSWGARLHFEDVFVRKDELEPFYTGRYVNEYFRGWESQGLRQYKQTVDEQVTHGVGLTYVLEAKPGTYTATFEVQNLADEKLYDFYGVQKPGRAFYLKLTADLR
jgi:TonB family protein